MNSRISSSPKSRLAWLALVLIPVFFSAACMTPQPQPSRKQAQETALHQLGFKESQDGWELQLASRMTFAVDDATLTAEDRQTLAHAAQVLLSIGIDRLTVEGHADSTGSEKHNKLLAERRAAAVVDALIQTGFKPEMITQRSHGASRPIADNSSEVGRARNRRAALIVPSF